MSARKGKYEQRRKHSVSWLESMPDSQLIRASFTRVSPNRAAMPKRIKFHTTGGTIAKVYFYIVYIAMNGRIFDPNRTRKNLERSCFEKTPVREG